MSVYMAYKQHLCLINCHHQQRQVIDVGRRNGSLRGRTLSRGNNPRKTKSVGTGRADITFCGVSAAMHSPQGPVEGVLLNHAESAVTPRLPLMDTAEEAPCSCLRHPHRWVCC